MALDFAILSTDGSPAEMVSLGMHQHDELMNVAEKLKLPKLLRFQDYFEDVDMDTEELPELAEEIALIRKIKPEPSLAQFFDEFKILIELAIRKKKQLCAIPD
jgi:hypothetical protein